MPVRKISLLTAVLMLALCLFPAGTALAGILPNPVISRDAPAWCLAHPDSAAYGCDASYATFWKGEAPEDWLAYDLSAVPQEQRRTIVAVWYNPSTWDAVGSYVSRSKEPTAYALEANSAPGGACPEDGWVTLLTVEDNGLSSRQHVLDFDGYNWIRLRLLAVDGKPAGTCEINLDIHDASCGLWDSWLFLGDSITAGGMNNCYGTGFATWVSRMDSRFFPIQENGGIGGLSSSDCVRNIDRWLETFPGRYVVLAYGTNDAWGNSTGSMRYYLNLRQVTETVLAAGKIPVIPKIPYSTEEGILRNLPYYNELIEQLYGEYPEIIPGPDFFSILQENPGWLSRDGIHPSSRGYEQMRRVWAETMMEAVYHADEP